MKLIALKPKIRIGTDITIELAAGMQVEAVLWVRLRDKSDRIIHLPLDVNLYFHIQNQKFRSRAS
jgi:hypothetical protein